MRFWTVGLCLGMLLQPVFLPGCSSDFSEKYYVGVWNTSDDASNWTPTQFYRFRVHGSSSLGSSTRYEAGWYDASAVDTLFGDVTPPASGAKASPPPPPAAGTVSTVPALATNDFGFQTLELQNAMVTPLHAGSGNPFSMGFSSVAAEKVDITLAKGSGNAAMITSITLTGIIGGQLKNADSIGKGSSKLKPFSFEAVPYKGQGTLDITFQLKDTPPPVIKVLGGSVNIIAQSPASHSGKTILAASSSDYYDFSVQGGRFNIDGGRVTQSGSTIQTTNAFVTLLTDASNPMAAFRATKGWTLHGAGAITIENNEAPDAYFTSAKTGAGAPITVTITGNPTLKFISTGADAAQKQIEAASQKITSGADAAQSLGISLSNVRFEFLGLPSKSGDNSGVGQTRPASQPGGNPPNTASIWGNATKDNNLPIPVCLKIESAPTDLAYVVPSATLKSGPVELTMADAVKTAVEAGKTVAVPVDAFDQAMYLFGPEGRSKAERDNQRFVIFMSSDPTELTSRVKALTNTQATQQAVAATIFGPLQAAAAARIQTFSSTFAQATKEAAAIKAQLTDSAASVDQLRARAAQMMNTLSASP